MQNLSTDLISYINGGELPPPPPGDIVGRAMFQMWAASMESAAWAAKYGSLAFVNTEAVVAEAAAPIWVPIAGGVAFVGAVGVATYTSITPFFYGGEGSVDPRAYSGY